MINLLPSKQKEELAKEAKFKIILILGLVVSSVFASQALLLFLIKGYIMADLEVQRIYSKERVEELKVPAFKELEDEIKISGRVFAQLDSFYRSQTKVVVVLERISQSLPEGLFLTSLDFNPISSRVSLSGFAPSREKILDLRKNLENEKTFSSIYFPAENWVKPLDISFNVVFKTK